MLDLEQGTDIGVFVGISHNDYQNIQGGATDRSGISAAFADRQRAQHRGQSHFLLPQPERPEHVDGHGVFVRADRGARRLRADPRRALQDGAWPAA